jgi:hypothetical protein
VEIFVASKGLASTPMEWKSEYYHTTKHPRFSDRGERVFASLYCNAPPGLDAITGTKLWKNNSARTPPATGRTNLICGHLQGLQNFILIHHLERRVLVLRLLLGVVFGDDFCNR